MSAERLKPGGLLRNDGSSILDPDFINTFETQLALGRPRAGWRHATDFAQIVLDAKQSGLSARELAEWLTEGGPNSHMNRLFGYCPSVRTVQDWISEISTGKPALLRMRISRARRNFRNNCGE